MFLLIWPVQASIFCRVHYLLDLAYLNHGLDIGIVFKVIDHFIPMFGDGLSVFLNVVNVEVAHGRKGRFVIGRSAGNALVDFVELQVFTQKTGHHGHMFRFIIVHVKSGTFPVGVQYGHFERSVLEVWTFKLGRFTTE